MCASRWVSTHSRMCPTSRYEPGRTHRQGLSRLVLLLQAPRKNLVWVGLADTSTRGLEPLVHLSFAASLWRAVRLAHEH